MLSCSSFGLLVLRVSLHDVRDFCMRLMLQGNSPRHDLVESGLDLYLGQAGYAAQV